MKYILAAFCVVMVFCCGAQSHQSPFKLDIRTDLTLLGTSVGSCIWAYAVNQRLQEVSQTDLANISTSDINALDRGLALSYSQNAQLASDVGFFAALALPGLFLSKKVNRSEYGRILVMGTEAGLLTTGLTFLAKGSSQRLRPYAYNGTVPISSKLDKDTRRSFFSGHTSLSACASFFTAYTLTQYNLKSWQKTVVWTSAITIPAFVGAMRVQGGKHFVTDVLAGYAAGALVGFGIPYLHKIEKAAFSLSTSYNGLSITYHIQ